MSSTMKDNEKGLYDKYTVINNEKGQPIDGDAFILRPDRDPAAVAALTAYAKTTDNKQLSEDILDWVFLLSPTKKDKCVACGTCFDKELNYCTRTECASKKQEREYPKPLTLDELREMDGEPLWLIAYDYSGAIHQLEMWVLIEVDVFGEIFLTNNLGGRDNINSLKFRFDIYRYKPQEANDEQV